MKKTPDKPMVVRVPDSIIKKLDRAAKLAQRSRSAEVRVRLERSLQLLRKEVDA